MIARCAQNARGRSRNRFSMPWPLRHSGCRPAVCGGYSSPRCRIKGQKSRRERLILGGHAATCWGSARNPGYHYRNMASHSPFKTRVSGLQQEIGAAWKPGHLLLLAEAFADHPIHGRFYKAHADAFAVPVTLAIVGNEALFIRDIGMELLPRVE